MSLKVPTPLIHTYEILKLTRIVKAISSKDAAALDKDLMDVGGFSLDQLMELAGLSVSQAGSSCRIRPSAHFEEDFCAVAFPC